MMCKLCKHLLVPNVQMAWHFKDLIISFNQLVIYISVLEYKQVPPSLKSTTVAFTNIWNFSSKDHDDGSTHKVLHRTIIARFPPHTTMGLVTTFPTLSLSKGSKHQTSSRQSHGIVTKLIHTYTLSKKSSVRSDNITDLNTHHKTSPTILQISTTTGQKTETIQRTPSTGITTDRVETRENESKIGILLFGRTTDSPINQSVSPFFDSKYSPGIVPSTRSKFINKEHSSTNYVVPSSETYLVSTADGRDLLSTKSNVNVVDSSMSTENKYIPDSSSTETWPLKSTLPVLKLDPITTDTLNGILITFIYSLPKLNLNCRDFVTTVNAIRSCGMLPLEYPAERYM